MVIKLTAREEPIQRKEDQDGYEGKSGNDWLGKEINH